MVGKLVVVSVVLRHQISKKKVMIKEEKNPLPPVVTHCGGGHPAVYN